MIHCVYRLWSDCAGLLRKLILNLLLLLFLWSSSSSSFLALSWLLLFTSGAKTWCWNEAILLVGLTESRCPNVEQVIVVPEPRSSVLMIWRKGGQISSTYIYIATFSNTDIEVFIWQSKGHRELLVGASLACFIETVSSCILVVCSTRSVLRGIEVVLVVVKEVPETSASLLRSFTAVGLGTAQLVRREAASAPATRSASTF